MRALAVVNAMHSFNYDAKCIVQPFFFLLGILIMFKCPILNRSIALLTSCSSFIGRSSSRILLFESPRRLKFSLYPHNIYCNIAFLRCPTNKYQSRKNFQKRNMAYFVLSFNGNYIQAAEH